MQVTCNTVYMYSCEKDESKHGNEIDNYQNISITHMKYMLPHTQLANCDHDRRRNSLSKKTGNSLPTTKSKSLLVILSNSLPSSKGNSLDHSLSNSLSPSISNSLIGVTDQLAIKSS